MDLEGRGQKTSREATLALRIVNERRAEKEQETFLESEDTEKSLTMLTEMIKILKQAGINSKDKGMIWKLYRNNTVM